MVLCVRVYVCSLTYFALTASMSLPSPFSYTVLLTIHPARRLRKVLHVVAPWSPLRILFGNVFSYSHLYSRRNSVAIV